MSLKLDLSLCDLKANPRDVMSVRDISCLLAGYGNKIGFLTLTTRLPFQHKWHEDFFKKGHVKITCPTLDDNSKHKYIGECLKSMFYSSLEWFEKVIFSGNFLEAVFQLPSVNNIKSLNSRPYTDARESFRICKYLYNSVKIKIFYFSNFVYSSCEVQ